MHLGNFIGTPKPVMPNMKHGTRFRIITIVALWSLLMSVAVIWLQLDNVRRSVREEIQTANVITNQIMQRIVWINSLYGLDGLKDFLDHLGRVRGNNIRLIADNGDKVIYQSPAATYYAGQYAPQWFAKLVEPPPARAEVHLVGNQSAIIEIRSDASRSVLEGWRETRWIVAMLLLFQLLLFALVGWLVHRTLRHIPSLVAACAEIQKGNFQVRLPVVPPQESLIVNAAFNQMAQSIAENSELRQRSQEAQEKLSESRQVSQWLQHKIEEERKAIARELHDEIGQSVTAINSLAHVLTGQGTAENRQHARLIADQARHLHDAVQEIIPRLRPMALDIGLAEALGDLIHQWERAHDCRVALEIGEGAIPMDSEVTLTIYRVVQEALSNIARHAQAHQVSVNLQRHHQQLHLIVKDDGVGMAEGTPLGFGLRGMQERVTALGGTLTRRTDRGMVLEAVFPVPSLGETT